MDLLNLIGVKLTLVAKSQLRPCNLKYDKSFEGPAGDAHGGVQWLPGSRGLVVQ
jgi:hypothetical protein